MEGGGKKKALTSEGGGGRKIISVLLKIDEERGMEEKMWELKKK